MHTPEAPLSKLDDPARPGIEERRFFGAPVRIA